MMTRQLVKVTPSVKTLILKTAEMYKYFYDKYRPMDNTDWKVWHDCADDWLEALMCQCALCGLDGVTLSEAVERDGEIARMERMRVLEFVEEFKRDKEAAA